MAEKKRKYKIEDTIQLWVKAGGRCEFPGCNEYLLEDDLTKHVYNLAELAHIVGVSKNAKSPRGQDSKKISERDLESNLMLLCSNCHTRIDKAKLIDKFPKELLLEYKKKHEDRIYYLTGLDDDKKSLVLRMSNRVREHSISISTEDIRETLLKNSDRYPYYLSGKGNTIEIDLSVLPHKINNSYWQIGKTIIDEIVREKVNPIIDRKEISHLSIFALARIPLLVYLGYKIGDKIKTDIYQKQRNDKEDWNWKKEKQVKFSLISPKKIDKNKNVVLKCSLSGEISTASLPTDLQKMNVYEITPKNVKASRNIIRTKASLHNFRNKLEETFRYIEANYSKIKIHLVLAIPLSAAITIGREILKNITPKIVIYDYQNKCYVKSFEIN